MYLHQDEMDYLENGIRVIPAQ